MVRFGQMGSPFRKKFAQVASLRAFPIRKTAGTIEASRPFTYCTTAPKCRLLWTAICTGAVEFRTYVQSRCAPGQCLCYGDRSARCSDWWADEGSIRAI